MKVVKEHYRTDSKTGKKILVKEYVKYNRKERRQMICANRHTIRWINKDEDPIEIKPYYRTNKDGTKTLIKGYKRAWPRRRI